MTVELSDPSSVAFSYDLWATRYPEFSTTVGPDLAAIYFAEAGLYLDNTACSLVQDQTVRLMILNMITAHIAALGSGTNGSPATQLVGRVANASEGSVSVGTNLGTPTSASGMAAFFQQTKYGENAWAAMAPFRNGGYYFPGAVPNLQTAYPNVLWGFGYGRGR